MGGTRTRDPRGGSPLPPVIGMPTRRSNRFNPSARLPEPPPSRDNARTESFRRGFRRVRAHEVVAPPAA